MPEAYIVEAVRTPVGKRGGSLAAMHPLDMAAHVLKEVVTRAGVDPGAVDDVILGCLDQIGPQAGDIARTAALAAGFPETVPGVTIDRQCGSSQQAVHFAAQAVMSGSQDLVIAGGVQNMSSIPMAVSVSLGAQFGFDDPYAGSEGWSGRFGSQEITQFRGADLIAERWDIDREALDAFSVQSHERAIKARSNGVFKSEIAAIGDFAEDEGPREPNWEKIRSLKPLREGGRITAAMASQISDGAAALLIANANAVDRYGLTPRARVHQMTVLGGDTIEMLSAPIPATKHALKRSGLSIDDIDVVEINEAFASVVLAWVKDLGADPAKVNPNGGAISLGHPLGATGARLMTSMLHELERTGGRYGLQTMCEGGGQANVTIIERMN